MDSKNDGIVQAKALFSKACKTWKDLQVAVSRLNERLAEEEYGDEEFDEVEKILVTYNAQVSEIHAYAVTQFSNGDARWENAVNEVWAKWDIGDITSADDMDDTEEVGMPDDELQLFRAMLGDEGVER